MPLTVVASGTTSALVIGTETNLEAARSPVIPATYIYVMDLGAMVVTANVPEACILRVYGILLTAGTERLAYCASFIPGFDDSKLLYSMPIEVDAVTSALRCTITQKVGTGRTVPWKLYSL